jgi:hypothetical protein
MTPKCPGQHDVVARELTEIVSEEQHGRTYDAGRPNRHSKSTELVD